MSREFYHGTPKTGSNAGKPMITEWPEGVVMPMGITYADVSIVPRNSDSEHRGDPTSVELGRIKLNVPVIASPMEFSNEHVIREMHRLGALGTLPRYNPAIEDDRERYLKTCKNFSEEGVNCLYAIGLEDGLPFAQELYNNGAKVILIDIANGGLEVVKRTAEEIRNKVDVDLVVGNIASYEQMFSYMNYGIHNIRVGVGPGKACKTRRVAGVGVGQMAAIFETVTPGVHVIADGGIEESGDVAKAIAAGAKTVMMGSYLAQSTEASGLDVGNLTSYRGQASKSYMAERGKTLNANRTAEGEELLIEVTGSLEEIINGITAGLRSEMTYVGAHNLEELYEKSRFVQMTSAARYESLPRGIKAY